MSWLFDGTPFDPSLSVGFVGFVYEIENLMDGRRYIGKKGFHSVRRVRRAKKKNRDVIKKNSDWETYWSSSDELQADVKKLGPKCFQRRILRLCKTKTEMNYYEAKFQFGCDVLLHQDRWYNRWIMVRVRPFRL
jgi:Kyanoviridae NAD synthetase